MRRLGPLVAIVLLTACGSDREALPVTGLSIDGDRLGVYDHCHEDPKLDVDENSTSVRIRFSVRDASGGDCFSCTVVTLNAPIGDRRVIDATTDKALAQDGDCFNQP